MSIYSIHCSVFNKQELIDSLPNDCVKVGEGLGSIQVKSDWELDKMRTLFSKYVVGRDERKMK